jgi:carotenoid 1,2-hydratase
MAAVAKSRCGSAATGRVSIRSRCRTRSQLSKGFWGVPRSGHHDPGGQAKARIVRTLEDGPFYTRSVMATRLLGEDIELMHESLSGDRFASPVVKAMLPFRMPRRAG